MRQARQDKLSKGLLWWVLPALLCLSGCVSHHYEPAPITAWQHAQDFQDWSADDPGLNAFLDQNGLTVPAPTHYSIARLYLTGLYYDPAMQLAYEQWQQARRVAANSPDYRNPELSIPLEHHSEDRESAWTVGGVLQFVYERKEKRAARKAKAQVQLFNAKLALTQHAHSRYIAFVESYYKVLIGSLRIAVLQDEINVLYDLLAQLQKRYELGELRYSEWAAIKLTRQTRAFELTRQENTLAGHRDQLLSMTQLVTADLAHIQIAAPSPQQLFASIREQTALFERDEAELQQTMLTRNLALAERFNDYALREAALRLEIERQYPDLVLSPGFIFDQSDNIWALGLGWTLPLAARTERNLAIVTALEARKIAQQEIIVLQKDMLAELYQNHRAIIRNQATMALSDELVQILAAQVGTLEEQFRAGGIDSTLLLRGRLEWLQARQSQLDIYASAITTLLKLQALLPDAYSELDISHVVTTWLTSIDRKNDHADIH